MTSTVPVLRRRTLPRLSPSKVVALVTVLSAALACTATVTPGDDGDSAGSGGQVGSGGTLAEPDGIDFFEGSFAGRPAFPVTSTGTGGLGGAGPMDRPCRKPEGIALPARKAVMDEGADTAARPVFTRDVFSQFQAHCGGCHVDTSLGGFDDQKVTLTNFAELVTQDAVDLMQSDDPDKFMPKPAAGGKAWSTRPEGDPIRAFAAVLQAWLDAGSPADLFFIEPEVTVEKSPYLMTPEEGEALTNIGSCIPSRAVFASSESTMQGMDAKFAKMTHLPSVLSQTDLTSWSGLEQARVGLLAVAPAYPLWSDGSGKLRQVRLPLGESMKFNAETSEFDVPDNTRVYKTFFKKVIEKDGREAHRKIETRLIVARADHCEGSTCETKALFGTYVWNDEETEAYLLSDPLRDGSEFRDRIQTYITDEAKAEAAGTNAVELAKATRHYALPGSERCVQCHMGSTTKNFLAGISPVQLNRVPYVKEPDELAGGDDLVGDGVLEEDAPSPDELEQFERMLDLGVVTGIESSALVPRLKELGSEPPRNDLELRAQGYMLGNCGLCHNPGGFPSVKLPELSALLDFYPRKDEGGIYHFPLERYSPRVKRGVNSDIDVPYVTPSVYDRPGGSTTPTDDPLVVAYRSKCMPRLDGSLEASCIAAPWRSLIYRNVDTPFTTADDYAIYPHMPRHTAGFDCRAPRILAEWMLGIPSMLKDDPRTGQRIPDEENVSIAGMFQPRREVDMSDTGNLFDQLVAKHDVKQNLQLYRSGERYSYCPDTSDIVDPEVLSGAVTAPLDKGQEVHDQPVALWFDGVPDRAHFVALDHTEVAGDWNPRRSDWAGALLREDPNKYAAMNDSEKRVVDLLAEEDLYVSDDFREFALTPQALGTWQRDALGVCSAQYAAMKALRDIPAAEQPYWADVSDPNLPLYEISPGAAVFGVICRNCHGPSANADSALADTIFDISGGTRVANLRDGLFGPASSPGQGAANVFGKKADALGITPDELSSRYLLWMALGGTQVQIPIAALKIVQNTKFLGRGRAGANLPSANMLSNAEEICRSTLPAGSLGTPPPSQSAEDYYTQSRPTVDFNLTSGMDMTSWGVFTPMIAKNGDAGMWTELCAKRQTSPVRAIRFETGSVYDFDTNLVFEPPTLATKAVLATGTSDFDTMYRLYDPEAYAANPVMTPVGVQEGVPLGESQVWCLEPALTEIGRSRMEEWVQINTIGGKPYPICPGGVRTWNLEDQRQFTLRGAMSAGLAVFTYLRGIARHEVTPPLGFDECQKLPKP